MAGRSTTTEVVIETNRDDSSLAYRRSEVDATVTLDGEPVELLRADDSRDASQVGDFGHGWRLANRQMQIQTNVSETGREHLGLYHGFSDRTRLYLTLPPGNRVGFSFRPEPVAAGSLTLYRPAWQSDPGVSYTLRSVDTLLIKAGSRYYDQATGQPYDPASPYFAGFDYTLEAVDGTQYHLDSRGNVAQQILPSGKVRYFTDSSVTTPSGQSIQFVRDAQGRIAHVLGPDGQTIRYDYDAMGNLVSVRALHTGERVAYCYTEAAGGRLTLAIPSTGAGETVSYGETVVTHPLTADLGGVDQFTTQAYVGSVPAGQSDRLSFQLTPGEIGSVIGSAVLLRTMLTTDRENAPLAGPVIDGLEPLSTASDATRQDALFAMERAGAYEILVSRLGGDEVEDYHLAVSIAGDINLDGQIDGLDRQRFDQAFGTGAGHPDYVLAADCDGNGQVDAGDRQILQANFGFLANRAPVPADELPRVRTHTDLAVAIPLDDYFRDPNGDRLFFRIEQATEGNARLTQDGREVVFSPSTGHTGPATVTVTADDGVLGSIAATIDVDVSGAALERLWIEPPNLRVDVGQATRLSIVGDFVDEEGVSLPSSYVSFVTSDAQVAAITDAGQASGRAEGSAVVTIQRGSVAAATTVTVGTPRDVEQLYLQRVGIDVYPASFSLPMTGGQRQLIVTAGGVDVSGSETGTVYVVGNTQVAQVSEDGLVQAIGTGETTVTILRGPTSIVVPIRVTEPQSGPVLVGEEGAVVQGTDGSLLAIGPSALSTPATVSIAPLLENDLTTPLPVEYTFAAAFELDLGGETLSESAQLAVPVNGIAAGETVYFFQEKVLAGPDGVQQPWWILIDSGVVGEDGVARTTSPPYPGFSEGGKHLCAHLDATGRQVEVTFASVYNQLSLQRSYATIPSRGFGFRASPIMRMATNLLGRIGTYFFSYETADTSQTPYVIQEVMVEIPDGVTHVTTTVEIPDPPTNMPVIRQAEYARVGGEELITIRGERLDRLDRVELTMGDRIWAMFPNGFVGHASDFVTLVLPEDSGLILGLTRITAIAGRNRKSNSVWIESPGGLGFMAAQDNASDYVGVFEIDLPQNANRMAGRIYLGDAISKHIRNTVTTNDNTRVYAAVKRWGPTDPPGGVAVVDAIRLKQYDMDPDADGENFIPLPNEDGASRIVLSPRNDFLYAVDEGRAVYVIDVRPDSPTFHQVVNTIDLPAGTYFMDGLAINADGRRLFVSARQGQVSRGSIIVINIDPADRPSDPSVDLEDESENPRYWHRVIKSITTGYLFPGKIVATSQADKLAFTYRNRDFAFGTLKITNDTPHPDAFIASIQDVNTRLRHRDPDFERYSYSIRQPWAIAVMMILLVPMMFIGFQGGDPPATLLIFFLVLLPVVFCLSVYVWTRFSLAMAFVVDRRMGVFESISESLHYTRGNVIAIFGAFMAISLIAMLFTLFTCLIGSVVAFPAIMITMALTYLLTTGQPYTTGATSTGATPSDSGGSSPFAPPVDRLGE